MQENIPADTSVLTSLFRHNAWANLKLLDFCEGLSDEQLDTAAVGCYGSIRATLLHIVRGEVSYVNRVNDRLPPVPPPREPFPEFQVLKDAVRWAEGELLQLALSARADTLVRQLPPAHAIEFRLADLMVQVLNHATEHRTQVSTIITQLGMEPPDMSGWKYMAEMGTLLEF